MPPMSMRSPLAVCLVLFSLLSAVGEPNAAEIEGWPRERVAADGTRIVVHQPQIDSWDLYVQLKFHGAAEFFAPDGSPPVPAAMQFEAETETNLQSRTVTIFNPKVVKVTFPGADEATAERLTRTAAGIFPNSSQTMALDRVLAYFEPSGDGEPEPQPVEGVVRPREFPGTPPTVFVSTRPAILIQFDGEPMFVPVEGAELSFAANTGWDVFRLEATSNYYLRQERTWLIAPGPTGPWSPAGSLPESFWNIPDDDNWTEVQESLPGEEINPVDVPRVLVATGPTELILIDGEPQTAVIPDTQLLWVTNTEADLFLHTGESQYYFLAAGRWLRSGTLDGPWTLAGVDLPEAFAAIPTDHPRAYVRASVPGTPEAQEAVMLAQIPQKAEVQREGVTVEVHYAGEPEFVPIEDTSLAYAANTSFDVIRFENKYYACYEGIWFVSDSPHGPWLVATEVPAEIYTIPPECPKYHVTYVHVYDSTPTTVVVGYTSGYTGVYVSWGYVVYGTGYWYYPYYRYPIYYPYPRTYGRVAHYNSHTGTYVRGRYAYGRYGGYARGAAYNPSTGTYARGATAWGPYGYGYSGRAHNPDTGASAARRGGGNYYSSWGRSVVQRDDNWARAGHYSDSRGTVAGFETSEGARGIGATDGDSRGFVGQGADDSLYAGKDGNVYRRDDDGWSKYEDGDWQQVDGPENAPEPRQEARDRAEQGDFDRGSASQRADEARADEPAGPRRPGPQSWQPADAGLQLLEPWRRKPLDARRRAGGRPPPLIRRAVEHRSSVVGGGSVSVRRQR
jgi:hypothetical protein